MGKYKIMTVEDNELFAMILDWNLKEDLDYLLTNVTSGEECIAQLDEWKPDMIIMDYNLPGLNGLDILKKIKKIKPKIKVIVLSSQTNVQVAVDLINAGAEQYIEKNNDPLTKLSIYLNEIRFK